MPTGGASSEVTYDGVRLSRHYLPAMVKRAWAASSHLERVGPHIPVEMTTRLTRRQLAISRGLANRCRNGRHRKRGAARASARKRGRFSRKLNRA